MSLDFRKNDECPNILPENIYYKIKNLPHKLNPPYYDMTLQPPMKEFNQTLKKKKKKKKV